MNTPQTPPDIRRKTDEITREIAEQCYSRFANHATIEETMVTVESILQLPLLLSVVGAVKPLVNGLDRREFAEPKQCALYKAFMDYEQAISDEKEME